MFLVQLKRLSLILLLLLCTSPATLNAQSMSIERVATGLSQPLFVTYAPGDASRLYIVERFGTIKIMDLASGNITNFMTVPGVDSNFEGGLLGLAFHPDFANNRYFYVNYTEWTGTDRSRIVRYTATNAESADPVTAETVVEYNQPEQNHNGGWLGFSPIDGYLYIATGDGGGGNDLHGTIGNGQDITNNLLGKILRLDVDGDDFPGDANRNYAIPKNNPFVGVSGDDEIFLYGLRNPWRCSFDRLTGDLYIGDVGQNFREEINVFPVNGFPDRNLGWRLREGTFPTPGSVGGPQPADGVNPIYQYPWGSGPFSGRSCTGGYVYRGPIGGLQGIYFFYDHQTNNFWSLRYDGSDPATFDGTNFTELTRWNDLITIDAGSIFTVASMGEDAEGNLYLLDRTGGEIFKIADAQFSVDGTLTGVEAVVGVYQSGSEKDLAESDGNTLNYSAEATAAGQPALELLIDGTVPATDPNSLVFQFESLVNTPNLVQSIEVFNYLTETFETFDKRGASTSNESITIEVSDPISYISAMGEVRARVRLTATGPVVGFPWSLAMDRIGWQILQ